MKYQTTLRDAVAFEGVGLHTGLPARARVLPAPADHGLRFRLDDAVEFPARADYVVETVRATVLGAQGRTVSTVEHLLSALLGCGIDNALIAVDGPEIPVADGSAKVFADAIEAVGRKPQEQPQTRWVPTGTHVFHDGEKLLVVTPAPSLRVRMTIDFPAPVGAQYFDTDIDAERYAREIAPARTFVYERDINALRERGLALGGSLENAVVFDTTGPLAPLRIRDEPVRHKILDLVGDFALLGAYPQCEVIAVKSGHKVHCTAVRELLASAARAQPVAAET